MFQNLDRFRNLDLCICIQVSIGPPPGSGIGLKKTPLTSGGISSPPGVLVIFPYAFDKGGAIGTNQESNLELLVHSLS